MQVKNFSLEIGGARETEEGYAFLPHGQQYTVRLGNHGGRVTDCVLTIDGKEIATFQLRPYNTATIETDPDDKGKGKFTFYQSDSSEGVAVGSAAVSKSDRGVVRAEFRPEKYRPPVTHYGGAGAQSVTRGGPSMFGEREEKTSGRITTQSMQSGVTGMSGHSYQRFQTVRPVEFDQSDVVVIELRLVVTADGPRPLKAGVLRTAPPPVE
jgi:hypothetical protein